MRFIKYTLIFVLIFGGLILAAASCEAFSFVGMAAGLAMLWIGAMLSNKWEEMVR